MNALATFSNRELNIWATLVLDVGVAIYYFSSVLALPSGTDLHGKAMAGIIGEIIVWSFTYSILVFGYINSRGEEKKDERDQGFEARANSMAYYVLTCAVVLLIGHVVLNSLFADYEKSLTIPAMLSPVVIANLLLFALILASMAKALTQLFYYRRGY